MSLQNYCNYILWYITQSSDHSKSDKETLKQGVIAHIYIVGYVDLHNGQPKNQSSTQIFLYCQLKIKPLYLFDIRMGRSSEFSAIKLTIV